MEFRSVELFYFHLQISQEFECESRKPENRREKGSFYVFFKTFCLIFDLSMPDF